MNESGPIKRPRKTYQTEHGFADLHRLRPNIWKASLDGKLWLLKTARDSSSASLMLLRREYELSRNLSHPFIASSLFFIDDSPAGPAIMMEYIEGRTLREALAENLPGPLRKKILFQILDAVEYLHRKELLHNDIKPENIMLSALGNDVKIIDFGFAENDADFLNRRLGGTAGASAPEVLSGDPGSASSASSDIYSLGGILQLLFPHKYGSIVRKCHRVEPARRYPDISSLRRAIIAHSRKPYIVFAALAVIVATLTVALPGYVRNRKIDKVCSDVTALYREAADSLENKLFTCRDEAIAARDRFFYKFLDYKKGLDQGLQFSCDTLYSRVMTQLAEKINQLPWHRPE